MIDRIKLENLFLLPSQRINLFYKTLINNQYKSDQSSNPDNLVLNQLTIDSIIIK